MGCGRGDHAVCGGRYCWPHRGAGRSAHFRPNPGAASARGNHSAVRRRYLALHALFFLAFFAITWLVFGTLDAPPGPAWVWLVLWILLGLSTAFLLLAGLFKTLVRSAKGVVLILVASLAAGCVAWKLGEWSQQQLWKPLGYATMTSTAAILRIGFERVSAEPRHSILGLNDFLVEIDTNCSGLEGMGLMAVVISVYVLLFRKELVFPNAWLLLAIGVAGAWIGNLVRLSGLMILGAYANPDVALGGFHSKAGWVFFCAIALVVGHIGRRSSFFSKLSRNAIRWRGTPRQTTSYLCLHCL